MTTLSFATPELINVSPNKVYLGNYCTLTGRYFDVDHPENNQVILNEKEVSIYRIKQVPNSDLIQITIIVPPDILPEPPTKNVELTIKVITNGEASNTLPLTIVPSPFISSINPNQAYPGDTVEVELEGFRTSLRAGRTSVDFGPGISVESLEVIDRYHLHIVLNIDENAEPGLRDVKVRYGRRRLTRYGGFEVLTPPSQARSLKLQVNEPQKVVFSPTVTITGSVNTALGEAPPAIPPAIITSVIPSEVRQGESYTLRIQGENTHFDQENSQLILGEDIELEEFKVLDASTIEAKIKVGNEAKVGERNLQVITGTEIAQSIITFKVRPGYGTIKGYLRDEDTGQVIVGALVSIKGTTLKVYTDENGYFELKGVPAGDVELVINAPNYGLVTLSVNVKNGETVDFTKGIEGIANSEGIRLKAKAILPGGPLRSIEALVANGATSLTPPADYDLIKQIITDTIITVGGSEMGVLDEDGNQLNPNIEGEGIGSLTPIGLREITEEWMLGETYLLKDILYFITRVFDWPDKEILTLDRWLKVLNEHISLVWNDNNYIGRDLLIILFNQGKEILSQPPVLQANTYLNPFQAYLLITSLMAYLIEAKEYANLQTNKILLASLEHSYITQISDVPYLILAQEGNNNQGNNQDIWKKMYFTWEDIAVKFYDFKYGGIDIGKRACNVLKGELESIIKGEDSNLIKLLFPLHSESAREEIIKTWKSFFITKKIPINELKAFRELGRKGVSDLYRNFLDEAIIWERVKGFSGLVKSFMDITAESIVQSLSSFAGDMMQGMWKILIKESFEILIKANIPEPPHIEKLEVLEISENHPYSGIRIHFSPSPTESSAKINEAGYPKFYYQIFRRDSKGLYRIAHMLSEEFNKDENGNYYYEDHPPEIGVVTYFIRCIRKLSKLPPIIPASPYDFEKKVVYDYIKSLLPGSGATIGLLEDLTNALLDYARAVQLQYSPLSNGKSIYFNPYLPKYPRIDIAAIPKYLYLPLRFDLVFLKRKPILEFLSISDFNQIFAIKNGELYPWADAYFAPPYQKGLAVDIYGNVYSENAASEESWGGKIFKYIFDITHYDGEREVGIRMDRVPGNLCPKPWIGQIVACSGFRFFGLGLGCYPVHMVDMTYGEIPSSLISKYGSKEGFFIINMSTNDIRFLPLKASYFECINTYAKPLNFALQEGQKLSFSPYSKIAYSWKDASIYFSTDYEIFRYSLANSDLKRMVANNDYTIVSGLDVDDYGNLYVADLGLGRIDLYPVFNLNILAPEVQEPITLYEDIVNPIDLSLSSDRKWIYVVSSRGLARLQNFRPFLIMGPSLPEGKINIVTFDHRSIQVKVKGEFILYPVGYPSKAIALIKDQNKILKAYRLDFEEDSGWVYVEELSIISAQPSETQVKVVLPQSRKIDINLRNINDLYNEYYGINILNVKFPSTKIVPEGDDSLPENFNIEFGQFNLPNYRHKSNRHRFILVSPLNRQFVGDQANVIGYVYPPQKVKISLDYQSFTEINPDEIGRFKFSLNNISEGYHILTIMSDNNEFTKIISFEASSSEQITYPVIGFITDSVTNIPLSNIRIYVKETGEEVFSDEDGFFVLRSLKLDTSYTIRVGNAEEE